MSLSFLTGEFLVFSEELLCFVFVQLTGVFFTLWYWWSPQRKLPTLLDPVLLEPATALAANISSGKVSL